MGFAAEVKEELCKVPLKRRCCAVAEAYGVLLFCNTFQPQQVRIITESRSFKARLPHLFRKAFRVDFDTVPPPGEGKGTFLIEQPEKMHAIYQAFGLEWPGSVSLHINLALLEDEHDRKAFLRGAFLAGGAITDPMKGFHMEIDTTHYSVGRETPALLQEMGFEPKLACRKGSQIIYFKQSNHIEDILITIGAPAAAMTVMTAKRARDIRGSVNRQVNCDSANLDKSVEAAQEQLDAIRTLEEAGVLPTLSGKLQYAARLRLDHAELSLAQLAALCDPPLSKSALNHRLHKLVDLAKDLETAQAAPQEQSS